MSKIIVDGGLKKRIQVAAFNGSKIAQLILEQLRNPQEETIKGFANYFDSVRISPNSTSAEVKITYCDKDLTNPNFPDCGNPDAAYLPENRKRVNVNTFLELFKNIDINALSSDDMKFFDSAMRFNSKIKIRISDKIQDIEKAYNEAYYSTSGFESTLHCSCMRYADKARIASDFYANFAGAKIIIAEDEDGNVCGRAILWEDVTSTYVARPFSYCERIYFNFDFVRLMILDFIKDKVDFRKTYNDYSHKRNFTALKAVPLTEGSDTEVGSVHPIYIKKSVPVSKWHKKGCPYLDTLTYLYYDVDDGLYLSNNGNNNYIATLDSTCGSTMLYSNVCPICGKVHDATHVLCNECESQYLENTPFGKVLTCKTSTYDGMKVPSIIMKGGKLIPTAQTYMNICKLTVQ